MTGPAVNFYELLRVASDASTEDVNAAYRRVALRVHPDQGGTEGLFRLIQQAWQVLSDPGSRAEHDRQLASEGSRLSGASTQSAGAAPALPEFLMNALSLYYYGRLDALHMWEFIDAVAAGERAPMQGIPQRSSSDVRSEEEARLVALQVERLHGLLGAFGAGRLGPDELSGEAMEVLGLAEP